METIAVDSTLPIIPCCVYVSGLDDEKTDREGEQEKSDSDSDRSEDEEKDIYDDNLQPLETPYIPNTSEELGQVRI